jgi:L-threonylcarbamoyladenylate synthase
MAVTGVAPVDEAIAASRGGQLIAFPTDTVYGIGARPDDPAATDRLFAAKHRPRGLTLPVLVGSHAEARAIARFDRRADRVAHACWPGALTLVLPRTARSRGWALGGDRGSIGVRVPDHPLVRALLEAGPLATSSANRSGEPPAATCDELLEVFGDAVQVYLCQAERLVGVASTVVSLLGPQAEILRAGDLDADLIQRLSAG